MKCAEGHRTADCPKNDRNTPATCVFCLGSHPANFKGCNTYQEILARKKKGNQQVHSGEHNAHPVTLEKREFPTINNQSQRTIEFSDEDFPSWDRKLTDNNNDAFAHTAHRRTRPYAQALRTSNAEQSINNSS